MYLFLWLLQNNLLDVKMLFEIQKPQQMPLLFNLKQHFSTSEAIPQKTQKRMLYFLINDTGLAIL